MIVDNCPAHPKERGLQSIKLVFLPPNTTSKTQPCDQGIIQNLKVQYPKRVLQKQITYTEKKKNFVITVLDALQQAWASVTPTTINNCFRFPHQTPETDNEDSDEEDDDIPLARLAGLNFADYTSVDNAIPTTETLTDDDIMEEITTSKDPSDTIESDDEQQTEEKPVPTLTTVIEMTESYQAYFESQDDTEELLPLLAKFNNCLARKQLKKKLHAKQSTLTDLIV